MLTRNGFHERSQSTSKETALLRVGLTCRSFSNIQCHRSRGTSSLRSKIEFLSFWQLVGNLIHQINVFYCQLPHFQFFELVRDVRTPLRNRIFCFCRPSSAICRRRSLWSCRLLSPLPLLPLHRPHNISNHPVLHLFPRCSLRLSFDCPEELACHQFGRAGV